MTAASILIPGKFVVLIGQLLITIVILHTRNDNIYAGLPANTNSNSDAFHSAESKFLLRKMKFCSKILFFKVIGSSSDDYHISSHRIDYFIYWNIFIL